jgi:hypothetical protein
MTRVNYDVTVIIDADDPLAKREEITRHIFRTLHGYPGVDNVGVIDVDRAREESALFLSANKKLESAHLPEWNDEEFEVMMALDNMTEEARNNRVRDLFNKCVSAGKFSTAARVLRKYNLEDTFFPENNLVYSLYKYGNKLSI